MAAAAAASRAACVWVRARCIPTDHSPSASGSTQGAPGGTTSVGPSTRTCAQSRSPSTMSATSSACPRSRAADPSLARNSATRPSTAKSTPRSRPKTRAKTLNAEAPRRGAPRKAAYATSRSSGVSAPAAAESRYSRRASMTRPAVRPCRAPMASTTHEALWASSHCGGACCVAGRSRACACAACAAAPLMHVPAAGAARSLPPAHTRSSTAGWKWCPEPTPGLYVSATTPPPRST